MPLTDLMWSEKSQTQKSVTSYDYIYMNSQNSQNESMGIKVRIVVDSGVGKIDQNQKKVILCGDKKWSVS